MYAPGYGPGPAARDFPMSAERQVIQQQQQQQQQHHPQQQQAHPQQQQQQRPPGPPANYPQHYNTQMQMQMQVFRLICRTRRFYDVNLKGFFYQSSSCREIFFCSFIIVFLYNKRKLQRYRP